MKKKMLFLGAMLAAISLSYIVAVGTDDPLITESYLNEVFMKDVKDYIDTSKAETVFSVVTVKKGESLIGGGGCEIILRQGKAEVIGADLGGLSDVTLAGDIPSGSNMPANHLLIIPRDDGRGFKAVSDVVVMIKGKYEIK